MAFALCLSALHDWYQNIIVSLLDDKDNACDARGDNCWLHHTMAAETGSGRVMDSLSARTIVSGALHSMTTKKEVGSIVSGKGLPAARLLLATHRPARAALPPLLS